MYKVWSCSLETSTFAKYAQYSQIVTL